MLASGSRKSVAVAGIATYVCVFAATLVLYGTGGPWQALLLLYPVSAYLIWRFVARRSLADMGLRLFSGWRSQFVVALAGATLLSVL